MNTTTNHAAVIAEIATRGVELKWHQTYVPPFDDADYYEGGAVVTVTCDGFGITVDRDGESDLSILDHHYKTPAEFRSAFPHGTTPDDGDDYTQWHNCGWFDLYRASDGSHIEKWDGVAHSLLEALDDAASNVIRVARDAKTIRDTHSGEPEAWIQDV